MTCHHVKDIICRGSTPVEGMASVAVDPTHYGWTTYAISFVEDAPHAWRVLWSGTSYDGKRRAWHSSNIYRTRREARNAWNVALVVEALL